MNDTGSQLSELMQRALLKAKQNGATDGEVNISQGAGFGVNVRMGQLETLEHYQDQSIDVTVYFGTQKGEASGTDFSDQGLDQLINAACDIAKFTAPDQYAGLPEQSDLATEFTDCDLYHPWDLSIDQAIEQTQICESIALGQDKRIQNSDGAGITTYSGWQGLANSRGFCHAYPTSRHSLSVSLIAKARNQMQTDGSDSTARDAKDLWTSEQVAQEAAHKVLTKLNPKPIKTGRYPVIFTPEAAKSLMGHCLNAMSGSRLYRESSFLQNQLGQQIFPDFMSLYEDPFVKKGLGSSPYDAEGVQVKAQSLIEAGILKTYLLSSYSARRLGLKPTGHAGGTHNLFVKDDRALYPDQAALLKTMGTGLLITDLMGQGVNLVTGNYSRGASGFFVKNGVIEHPVEEITLAGDLREMFRNIIAIAGDIDTRGSLHVGSLLIDQMTVAAK